MDAISAQTIRSVSNAKHNFTTHSMIGAESVLINSSTVKDALLSKVAPNARTLPMSIKEPAFPVEASVLVARNAQIKIYAQNVFLMHITWKVQYVFSVIVH